MPSFNHIQGKTFEGLHSAKSNRNSPENLSRQTVKRQIFFEKNEKCRDIIDLMKSHYLLMLFNH